MSSHEQLALFHHELAWNNNTVEHQQIKNKTREYYTPVVTETGLSFTEKILADLAIRDDFLWPDFDGDYDRIAKKEPHLKVVENEAYKGELIDLDLERFRRYGNNVA